jgi:hypothetical protein
MTMNTITETTREDSLIQAHLELFEAESACDWKQVESCWHNVLDVVEGYETYDGAGLLNHLRGWLVDTVTNVINDHEEGSPYRLESMLNILLTCSRMNETFGGYVDVFWLRVLTLAMDAGLSMSTLDAIVSVWFATTDRDFRVI